MQTWWKLFLLLFPGILCAQDLELCVQTGHTRTITDLAFSPDGKYLISSGDDHKVIIWDLATGRQLRSLEGHRSPVNRLAVHPGGDMLASVSDDATVILWNIYTGELLKQVAVETDHLKSLGFVNEGRSLVIAGRGVYHLDLEDFQPSLLPGLPEDQTFDCIGTGNQVLAVGGRKGIVYVYDIPSESVKAKYRLVCNELAVSSDEQYIAGAGLNGKLRRWDLHSDLSKVTRLSIPAEHWISSFLSVAISPDEQYFAGGNRNQNIYVYDMENARTKSIIQGHQEKVTALAISPDNRYLASAGKDRLIHIWNLEDGVWAQSLKGFIGSLTALSYSNPAQVLSVGDNTGTCVVMEHWPDGRVFSTRIEAPRVRRWLGWRMSIEGVRFDRRAQLLHVDALQVRETKRKNQFALKSKAAQYTWSVEDGEVNPVKPGASVEVPDIAPFKNPVLFASFPGYSLWLDEAREHLAWQLTGNADSSSIIGGTLKETLSAAQISEPYLALKTSGDSVVVFDMNSRQAIYSGNCGGPIALFREHLYLADGREILQVHLSDKSQSRFPTSHTGVITSFDFIKDQQLVTGGSDGSLCFSDLASQEEMYRMVAVPPRDKILLSPENYYMSTKGALKGVSYTVGGDAYSFEQFDLIFNRPDKVLEYTGLADSFLIDNYRLAYEKRLRKLGKTTDDLALSRDIPQLELSYDASLLSVKQKEFRFGVAGNAIGSELSSLHVQVNGVPEFGSGGFLLEGSRKNSFEKEITLELSSGVNDIQVFLTDAAGNSSMRRGIRVNYAGGNARPDLYLLSIGTSRFEQEDFNLNYAAKDASDVSSVFQDSKAFNEVHRKQLKDEEVTLESIQGLQDFISRAGVNDVVILFMASHGLVNEEWDYYLSSYDVDFSAPESRGIPYEQLESLLGKTKARRKVLFLDACHSGELDKEELELGESTPSEDGEVVFRSVGRSLFPRGMNLKSSFELSKVLFADMRNSNGATVVSSAGGAEYALEGSAWQNGVFTFCMLKGITEKEADSNKDGEVMLSELQEYINREVPRLTGGRQTPTSRIENLNNDFRIW